MSLAQLRAVELAHLNKALLAEFGEWRARSESGQPLEKHHSQIRRITNRLEGFLAAISGAPGAPASFDSNERAMTYLLGAHRIWNFFRSKFTLRDSAWLQDDLMCADELAWQCYSPAHDRAAKAGAIKAEELKEPPLVFFSSDASPFAQARDTLFLPEKISERDVLDFGKAIFSLPIPIVGIPWLQVSHLPSAVIIGHEVGHAVEHDFKLEGQVEGAISRLVIPEERKSAWLAWREEIFADVYGILCTGPAYIIGLMRYLIAREDEVEKETRTAANWGTYPTRYLRVELNFELLHQLGLAEKMAGILENLESAALPPPEAWRETYSFHLMKSFMPDVPGIVEALRTCAFSAFGEKPLEEVITFTAEDLEKTASLALRVNKGVLLPSGTPMRRLYAAATLAYYADPLAYQEKDGARKVVTRILDSIPPGVRSSKVTPTPDQLSAADHQAGKEMVNLFQTVG